MRKEIFILVIVIVFLMGAYFFQQVNQTACTMEAKICPDGGAVGRNASNNCEFDSCPEIKGKNYCNPEDRNAQACDGLYSPVCGWVNSTKIQCIKYPCAQTFENSCMACINEDIDFWTAGECPE